MRRSGRKTTAETRWLPAARFVPALLLLALVAYATEASATEAAPVSVRISEDFHAGCPKEPGMLDRLRRHLGHVHEARRGEAAIDLLFRTELRGGVSRGTLTLIVGGVSDERTASSQSCDDVLAALSMMAAIAIGEDAALSSRAAPAAPPPLRPASPKRAPLRSKAPVHARRIAMAFGAGFEASGNRGGVWLPNWFAQLTLPLPLDPMLRVGLARSTRERLASSSGSIAVRWSEITFAACADVVRKREFRLGPCVNFEIGSLEATVVAPLPARNFSYPWLTAGASAKFGWRVLPPISVEMMAGLRAPLIRTELFFEPGTGVYRAPLLVPFAAVGFVAHLP